MADLRDRLQGALGSTYQVQKELGGGGMSRVFLADETRLGRSVVVKDLWEGANLELQPSVRDVRTRLHNLTAEP